MSEDSKRIVELLEELVKWKRFEGAQLAKKTLQEIFSKDAEKLIYQYSDGKASRKIADISGVSDFSVRNYWRRWNIEGLVVPSQKYKGRYERVFSLKDFGMEIPATKELPPKTGEQKGDENNE